ncbi:MAG: hypothetical protein ACM34K_05740 [Bacillota bacterium]
MEIPTITVTDFAIIKKCSRQTVYNNIQKFNLNEKGRIIWDKKAKNWKPDKNKVNQKWK